MIAGINGHICQEHSNPRLPPPLFCLHRRCRRYLSLILAAALAQSSLKLLCKEQPSAEEIAVHLLLQQLRPTSLLLESKSAFNAGMRKRFHLRMPPEIV